MAVVGVVGQGVMDKSTMKHVTRRLRSNSDFATEELAR